MSEDKDKLLSPAARHKAKMQAKALAEQARQADGQDEAQADDIITPEIKAINDNPRLTPAERHKQRTQAKADALAKAQDSTSHGAVVGGIQGHIQAAFVEHQRKLKDIQSDELKGEYKARILDDFSGYIAGVLEADAGGQDDMLTLLMLWHVDAGLFVKALTIAQYCFKHSLTMPQPLFKRTIGTVLVDEIVKAYIAGKMGTDATAILECTIALTEKQDMPDPARGGLFKAHAFELIGRKKDSSFNDTISLETAKQAYTELSRAAELMPPYAGAKKELERLEKFIAEKEKTQTKDNPQESPPAVNGQEGKESQNTAGTLEITTDTTTN